MKKLRTAGMAARGGIGLVVVGAAVGIVRLLGRRRARSAANGEQQQTRRPFLMVVPDVLMVVPDASPAGEGAHGEATWKSTEVGTGTS